MFYKREPTLHSLSSAAVEDHQHAGSSSSSSSSPIPTELTPKILEWINNNNEQCSLSVEWNHFFKNENEMVVTGVCRAATALSNCISRNSFESVSWGMRPNERYPISASLLLLDNQQVKRPSCEFPEPASPSPPPSSPQHPDVIRDTSSSSSSSFSIQQIQIDNVSLEYLQLGSTETIPSKITFSKPSSSTSKFPILQFSFLSQLVSIHAKNYNCISSNNNNNHNTITSPLSDMIHNNLLMPSALKSTVNMHKSNFEIQQLNCSELQVLLSGCVLTSDKNQAPATFKVSVDNIYFAPLLVLKLNQSVIHSLQFSNSSLQGSTTVKSPNNFYRHPSVNLPVRIQRHRIDVAHDKNQITTCHLSKLFNCRTGIRYHPVIEQLFQSTVEFSGTDMSSLVVRHLPSSDQLTVDNYSNFDLIKSLTCDKYKLEFRETRRDRHPKRQMSFHLCDKFGYSTAFNISQSKMARNNPVILSRTTFTNQKRKYNKNYFQSIMETVDLFHRDDIVPSNLRQHVKGHPFDKLTVETLFDFGMQTVDLIIRYDTFIFEVVISLSKRKVVTVRRNGCKLVDKKNHFAPFSRTTFTDVTIKVQ